MPLQRETASKKGCHKDFECELSLVGFALLPKHGVEGILGTPGQDKESFNERVSPEPQTKQFKTLCNTYQYMP